MKVIVCGGRDYSNFQKVHSLLEALNARYGITEIAQGGATGADMHAWSWARANGVGVQTFKADWEKLGPAAGPERNRHMLEVIQPHLVVGFEGNRGTAHMTELAADRGFPVLIVPDPEWREAQLDSDDVLTGLIEMYEDAPRRTPYWLREPDERHRLVARSSPTPVDRYLSESMF